MSDDVKIKKPKRPSKYVVLRSRLIAKGTNFSRWAADNDFPYTTVISAAKGERAGIKSVKIKKELEEFANA